MLSNSSRLILIVNLVDILLFVFRRTFLDCLLHERIKGIEGGFCKATNFLQLIKEEYNYIDAFLLSENGIVQLLQDHTHSFHVNIGSHLHHKNNVRLKAHSENR